MKITIKDIARMAGVSTATVSLILNHKGDRFSKHTVEKVWRIAEENHYYPDFFAKNLITKQDQSIGVVLPDVTDYFFSRLFEGIERVMSEHGYSVILYHSNHKRDMEEKGIQLMLSRSVSGLILATPYALEEKQFDALRHRCPFVLVDRGRTPRREGKFLVDERSGMVKAVRHLVDKGAQRIAFIKEDKTYYQLNERFEGYKEGLKEAGLSYDERYVMIGELSTEGGFQATQQLLDSGLSFDAVVCANDYLAFGAAKALQLAGLVIPDDVMLVGFDDIDMSAYMMPALTTVRQPIFELGAAVAQGLLDKIQEPDTAVRSETFDTSLIVRDSTNK